MSFFILKGEKLIFKVDSNGVLSVYVFVNRLRGMLDKGGFVKTFVDALQQLTNPEMIFKVI